MEAMRESWTDDRLDYLNQRVDDGFKHVDERFDRFERQIFERFDQAEERAKERFDEVDRRLDLADSRFEQINERMLELHRLIIQGGIAMLVALLTVLATQL